MSNAKVAIVLRVRRADGTRGHYSAVETPNGRLKPFWGQVNGNPEHLPGAAYYLGYSCEGDRMWECIGSDPQLALTTQIRENTSSRVWRSESVVLH